MTKIEELGILCMKLSLGFAGIIVSDSLFQSDIIFIFGSSGFFLLFISAIILFKIDIYKKKKKKKHIEEIIEIKSYTDTYNL